ncbi:serine O-acetyltransferase EpsC [Actinokineospora sp.]|uniref:serine O-acetyltransferase EpsC n=1 Tax=Actinokineospora sp. TaxID=1872133 RepID=UPI003D6B1D10
MAIPIGVRTGVLGGVAARVAEDVRTVLAKDPAARSFLEALLHPTLPALWAHRCAHALYLRDWRIGARLVANLGRLLTGVEIHPGARIGRRIFIDHGNGVVIGETAVIGDDVMLYHQVTLGAVGWWRDNQRPTGERRHPLVGNGVVLGAGAMVLGLVDIGPGAVIGAQSLVLGDVAPGQRISSAHRHKDVREAM